MEQLEFYGDASQILLQQRYYRLWPYLMVNPRLSFVGRAIGIDEPELDEVTSIAGLARELGVLSLAFTSPAILDLLCQALEEQGLKVGRWQHLQSNQGTEEKCRSMMAARQLPPGYRIDRITPATPGEILLSFQELMQGCGIAPFPGYFLRGRQMPVIAAMILSPEDLVVATGVGIFRHNPVGPFGKAVHVGSLATDPDHRGQGLARLLLATINLACYREQAAELLYTGVRAENTPSLRVCRDCGLYDSGMHLLGVVYPPMLGRTHFTS